MSKQGQDRGDGGPGVYGTNLKKLPDYIDKKCRFHRYKYPYLQAMILARSELGFGPKQKLTSDETYQLQILVIAIFDAMTRHNQADGMETGDPMKPLRESETDALLPVSIQGHQG